MSTERVIARGRDSEIVDLGGGQVLRRYLPGGDPNPGREADFMNRARRHGFPVPRVDAVRPDGLVLEYVEGPTMADAAFRDSSLFAEHAETLARLHDELHRIRVPEGGVLIHLDLHPRNVILSPHGPVVIDWANADGGHAAVDPALTWVILMTSAGPDGRAFAHEFERHIDVESGRAAAVDYRLHDRNLTAEERGRVQHLAE